MSQNKVQQHSNTGSNSGSFTIAGKVFILGEYAVLAGLPSVVAALGPRFLLKTGGSSHYRFHAESPLGRLTQQVRDLGLEEFIIDYRDPYQGRGGFGSSTAQFAMAFLAYFNRYSNHPQVLQKWGEPTWKTVWKLYRELMDEGASKPAPSGADLVAQWQGGISYFDRERMICEDLWSHFDWSSLLVFSATHQAGRKVATHDHLALFSNASNLTRLIADLKGPLEEGIQAIRENDSIRLGVCMNRYSEELSKNGLEISATSEDRKAFLDIPDVLGVKGSGAMQSDSVLVLVKAGSPNRSQIISVAQNRGLELIADGLTHQKGVLCQNPS